MDRVQVILFLTDHNRSSLAALAGALESTPCTDDAPICVAQGMGGLEEALRRQCGRAERAIVGFSFNTLSLIEAAIQVGSVKEFLRRNPAEHVVLVAGGAHPSAAPEETLKLGFDYVVVGEGEASFPAFVSAVAGRVDPLAIKGVAALREGKLIASGRSERADLAAVFPFGRKSMIFSYVEITRGCARACRFCEVSYRFGGRPRHRPVRQIEEAAGFLADVGRKDIHFLSPDALSYGCEAGNAPNLTAVEDLLRRAASAAPGRNLFFGSFPSEVWPASVTDRALEIIRKHAANDNLIIGAQSGSQATLDRMRRRHSVQDVETAVERALKWGFIANVDFIFGFPGESEADRQATIDLMLRLADRGAAIHSHAFLPLPGTPLSHEPPPRLPERLTKVLDRLAGQGKQYGSWQTQLDLAQRVHAFRARLAEAGAGDSLRPEEFLH